MVKMKFTKKRFLKLDKLLLYIKNKEVAAHDDLLSFLKEKLILDCKLFLRVIKIINMVLVESFFTTGHFYKQKKID